MSYQVNQLAGQEGAHNSKGCIVSSCGASNPMAGLLARQIIDQINSGQGQSLQASHSKADDVQSQSAGGRQSGPSQGRA